MRLLNLKSSGFISVLFLVAAVHATARHEVNKNDTLSHIAQHHLGDAQHWPLLHQRNAHHVKNPHLINPVSNFISEILGIVMSR